ncbi:MAG: MFS transporter [Paracoccaceae bacterium]|nr:MFS transporter [Paracoccaceae bacterium]MDG2257329.1 MFS transporter [Paracoccaceae bacterium]
MTNVAATRWIFLLQPLILGAWFPRIPQIQNVLDLSVGQLAFALIGMPIGLLSALSFGAKIAEFLGTRRLLTMGMIVQCLLLPLPAFAWSGPILFVALTLAGLSLAMAQLALNVTASLVEAQAGRAIMNGCHGFWSVGALIGSAYGVVCASIDISPSVSLAVISALIVAPLIYIAQRMSDFTVPAKESETQTKKRVSTPLMCVSFYAFGIAMAEGAMADWSAIYLADTYLASPGLSGAGYTAFAAFVAIGRFLGDPMRNRFLAHHLARVFASISLLGLATVVLSPSVIFGFIGITILGFGLSLGFPMAVSAVSILPGLSRASNVAILTQVTLSGFLIGPPLIGLIADHYSIRFGLAALAPTLVAAVFLAQYFKPKHAR